MHSISRSTYFSFYEMDHLFVDRQFWFSRRCVALFFNNLFFPAERFIDTNWKFIALHWCETQSKTIFFPRFQFSFVAFFSSSLSFATSIPTFSVAFAMIALAICCWCLLFHRHFLSIWFYSDRVTVENLFRKQWMSKWRTGNDTTNERRMMRGKKKRGKVFFSSTISNEQSGRANMSLSSNESLRRTANSVASDGVSSHSIIPPFFPFDFSVIYLFSFFFFVIFVVVFIRLLCSGFRNFFPPFQSNSRRHSRFSICLTFHFFLLFYCFFLSFSFRFFCFPPWCVFGWSFASSNNFFKVIFFWFGFDDSVDPAVFSSSFVLYVCCVYRFCGVWITLLLVFWFSSCQHHSVVCFCFSSRFFNFRFLSSLRCLSPFSVKRHRWHRISISLLSKPFLVWSHLVEFSSVQPF